LCGFSGGGSSTPETLAHTHNQSLANDGGDLSETLTDMNGVPLYSLITDNSAAVAANTAAIAANASEIVANTVLISANTASITALGVPPFATQAGIDAHKLIRWVDRDAAAANEWSRLEYSPTLDQFCSVSGTGTGNRVMTSTDGENWTSRTSAADYAWYGLAWSEDLSLWCAFAGSGASRVMTSPDGITWTLRSNDNFGWQDVCASDGAITAKFCGVANNGGALDTVSTSPDGITWTARTPANNYHWNSIGWNGSDLFVAVASSGTGDRFMSSPDGITWTARTSTADNSWNDIVYSPSLSLWCAVSSNGTNRAATSPDGITWTARTPEAKGWIRISWSDERAEFIAAADGFVTTSFDGITWTLHSTPAINPRGVAWDPLRELYAGVGPTAPGAMSTIL